MWLLWLLCWVKASTGQMRRRRSWTLGITSSCSTRRLPTKALTSTGMQWWYVKSSKYIIRTIEVLDKSGVINTVTWSTKQMSLLDTKQVSWMLIVCQAVRRSLYDADVCFSLQWRGGRTGTCICVYKLNNKVRRLDPFLTVMEMRRQRMIMVPAKIKVLEYKIPQIWTQVKCSSKGRYLDNVATRGS